MLSADDSDGDKQSTSMKKSRPSRCSTPPARDYHDTIDKTTPVKQNPKKRQMMPQLGTPQKKEPSLPNLQEQYDIEQEHFDEHKPLGLHGRVPRGGSGKRHRNEVEEDEEYDEDEVDDHDDEYDDEYGDEEVEEPLELGRKAFQGGSRKRAKVEYENDDDDDYTDENVKPLRRGGKRFIREQPTHYEKSSSSHKTRKDQLKYEARLEDAGRGKNGRKKAPFQKEGHGREYAGRAAKIDFNVRHAEQAIAEKDLLDQIEDALETPYLDLSAFGKLVRKAQLGNLITKEYEKRLRKLFTQRSIDVQLVATQLSVKQRRIETLCNMVTALSLNHNLPSLTTARVEVLEGEVQSVVRHFEKKVPAPVELSNYSLDVPHVIVENDFFKATNLKTWFKSQNISIDNTESRVKNLLRMALEQTSKSVLHLWYLSYRNSNPGTATRKFIAFPMDSLATFEQFLLDALNLYLPTELVGDVTDSVLFAHTFAPVLGMTEESQRAELDRRQLFRVDSQRQIRDSLVEILQYFRTNRHYDINTHQFATCSCRQDKSKLNKFVHWNQLEKGRYTVRDWQIIVSTD